MSEGCGDRILEEAVIDALIAHLDHDRCAHDLLNALAREACRPRRHGSRH